MAWIDYDIIAQGEDFFLYMTEKALIINNNDKTLLLNGRNIK